MNLTQFAEYLGVSKQAVARAVAGGELAGVVRWTESPEGQRRATIDEANLDRAVVLWRSRHRAPALADARPAPKERARPPAPPARPAPPGAAPPAPVPVPAASPPAEPAKGVTDWDPLADIAAARLQFEGYKAKLERLEYEKASGRLIDVERAKQIFGRQIQEAKNAVLALGKHARSRLPHLTVDDVLVIESLAREALEGLAAGAIEKP